MEIKLKIDEILKYTQPTKFIAKEIIEKGNVPVLTANKSFIIGYTNEEENIFSNVPCIIFDDFTCDMKYVDFSFKIRSSAIKILNLINNENNIKYIYELIKKIKFDNIDHKRYWISEFSKQQISLIDINKQKMIGEFLSNIDRKILCIENKINLSIKMKKLYMNKIYNLKNNYIFLKIKNVSKVKQGSRPIPLEDPKFYSDGGVPYVNVSQFKNNRVITTFKGKFNSLGQSKSYFVKKNSLVMTCAGTIGKVAIMGIDSCIRDGIAHFYDLKVDKMFLYFFLENNSQKFERMTTSSTTKLLSTNEILNTKIFFSKKTKNIDLQKSIGIFFLNIEKNINNLEMKINLLKEYKQKFLKYLFK